MSFESVVIESLLLASSGLLSFGSITIVILLLTSDRGWTNGLGYTLGYYTSYTIIGILVVLLGYQSSTNVQSGSSNILPVILLFLSGLLFFIAFRSWRKPPTTEKKENRFFAIVNGIRPIKAFGFGALVTVINFKNLALFLAAQSVVVLSDLSLMEKLLASVLVAMVFSLSVIIPVILYIIFPNSGKELLSGLKDTIDQHSRIISIWVPILFGLIFALKGVNDLL